MFVIINKYTKNCIDVHERIIYLCDYYKKNIIKPTIIKKILKYYPEIITIDKNLALLIYRHNQNKNACIVRAKTDKKYYLYNKETKRLYKWLVNNKIKIGIITIHIFLEMLHSINSNYIDQLCQYCTKNDIKEYYKNKIFDNTVNTYNFLKYVTDKPFIHYGSEFNFT